MFYTLCLKVLLSNYQRCFLYLSLIIFNSSFGKYDVLFYRPLEIGISEVENVTIMTGNTEYVLFITHRQREALIKMKIVKLVINELYTKYQLQSMIWPKIKEIDK